MLKVNYSLKSDTGRTITDIPVPTELNMRVRNLVLKTAKGKLVKQGEIIAEHPAQHGMTHHAAASGKITKVNYHHLTILCDEEKDSVPALDIMSMGPGKDLLLALHNLGINVAQLTWADTLIINGLNPEPGISVTSQLLKTQTDVLETGLGLAQKLIMPRRTVLAAPSQSFSLAGAETAIIEATYPTSLDPLTVKAVTGKENPEDVHVINISELYNLGLAALHGLPITRTIMTIKGHNYSVPIGTPIRYILEMLDIQVTSGDKVVLGGPFRGEAVYSLSEGVKKGDYGLLVIPANEFPPIEDATCINCGECVLNCPGRVQPNLISRYAEYEMFEMAEKCGLHSCLECGLCSFNCTARRPILQYIRLAKEQLLAKGQAAS